MAKRQLPAALKAHQFKKGHKKGTPAIVGHMSAVGRLKSAEYLLEAKGGPKTPAELALEAKISKLTGKPYKGAR